MLLHKLLKLQLRCAFRYGRAKTEKEQQYWHKHWSKLFYAALKLFPPDAISKAKKQIYKEGFEL